MSRQTDILAALKELAKQALPAADLDVIEPGDDLPAPDRVSPGGRIVFEYGDPGEPEIDLCPVTYNYQHQIPVSFAAARTMPDTSVVAAISLMLTAFGAAIASNRTLDGLVDYLDAYAPAIDEIYAAGGTPTREAQAVLIATYSTNQPL